MIISILLALSLAMTAPQAKVRPITLAQLENRFSHGNDTTYIVNFWATWCAPCVAELPYFDKFQVDHRKEPVKVLLVSMDFQSQLKHSVIPFLQKKMFTAETRIAVRKSDQDFINGVNKDWSGALPVTWVVSKGSRKLYEKEFTYKELTELYTSLK